MLKIRETIFNELFNYDLELIKNIRKHKFSEKIILITNKYSTDF